MQCRNAATRKPILRLAPQSFNSVTVRKKDGTINPQSR
jgi:hypothetical protein